jgi:sRNA-binding protein
MAKSRGMTLEEAAGGGPAPKRPEARFPHFSRKQAEDAFGLAKAARMTDAWTQADKARRDAAMEEARRRGLDEEERRKAAAAANRVPRRNDRKRDPQSHARVLLQETSLPLEEISTLTGLDIYQVVGIKLKLRPASRRD